MMSSRAANKPVRELIVTNHYVFEPGEHSVRLVIRTSHITIEGKGAVLVGPGTSGDTNSLAEAGIGILIEGTAGVVLQGIKVRGFATGLELRHSRACAVVDADFSDNYHNPGHGWGELPARGGILCDHVTDSVIRRTRADRVWDGIHLIDSNDNLITDSYFSHCSNTGGKLWRSSRNKFVHNDFSYGIRIDRAAGEVHARDSTGVLIETGSNDNYWFGNDIRYGGDGIFIRPLNRWVSRGNVFVENDTSYANNNCVESWSPGNVFIRNKANHGSYGFWLGGSDQTVLIGNEAAFNGLTNGNHNAPEPGFRHGGIVLVSGSSSHTLLEGNDVHDNDGAGIVFRGDVGSKGATWKTEHWIIQRNRIANNRFGIWGRWGEGVTLAANTFIHNAEGNYFTNVTSILELAGDATTAAAPVAQLNGPSVIAVGDQARFDASSSSDLNGAPLRFHWFLSGNAGTEPILERAFKEPGFYRLGLTVENGALAGLAWKDLFVIDPTSVELGTEQQAQQWDYQLEANENGIGRVRLDDDSDCLIGRTSLRFSPDPYPGAYATITFPKSRDARWNWQGKRHLRFWIKSANPNLPGWQNAGPVIRLHCADGQVELKPAKEGNLLEDSPYSEARWLWSPVVVPLTGDSQWERHTQGQPSLGQIGALSLSLDSWGGEPFTVWLDGLTVD